MTPKINRSEVSFEVAQVLSEGRLAHFNVVFRGFRFGTLLSWVCLLYTSPSPRD